MPINPSDTVLVQFIGSCFNQRIMLDLTYRCTVGSPLPTPVLLNELANDVAPGGPAANDIGTSYLACLPPQYNLLEIKTQVLRAVRSAYVSVGTPGTVGTNANPATVACDSAAITRRTLLAGRNQVSTLKVGPCPDGASVAGLLTAAYSGLLSAFAARTLITQVMGVSTAQYVPTILDNTGAASGRDLISFFVQPESRVMRRRVVGRGI